MPPAQTKRITWDDVSGALTRSVYDFKEESYDPNTTPHIGLGKRVYRDLNR